MPVLSDRAKEQDSHQSIKTFQIYLILRIIYIASLVLHNLNQGVIPTQGYRKHYLLQFMTNAQNTHGK